jgi:predicted amidohydrolase YtcJ
MIPELMRPGGSAHPPDLAALLDGHGRVLIRSPRILAGEGHRPTEAILLDGERIAALGGDAMRAALGGERPARTVDLPGTVVVPGFIDAHTHLVHLGLGLGRLDLGGAVSSAEALDQVRVALAVHDPDRPFIAENWDDGRWSPGDRLARPALDALAPRTPVILRRVCGHLAIANGAALDALGARAAHASHLAQGLVDAPRGLLLEDAAMRLREVFPPTPAEIDAALDRAEAHAHSLGVTGVHDIAEREGIAAFSARRREGRLRLRVTVHVDRMQVPALARLGLGSGPGDSWLKLGGVKLYLDGSLGARTAALRAPYADRPAERGRLLLPESALLPLVRRIDAMGVTAVLHAIGDAAIATALAALAALGPAAVRARRHRIEHAELMPDDLVRRMADIGATASMQPNFPDLWGHEGGMYERAVGRERLQVMNRFHTLRAAGIPLAFGSDCMPMGPVAGLRGATAHPLAGERLSASAALAAYTQGAARAGFSELEMGTIAPGMLADLTVLDRDPSAIGAPGEECRVLATVIGGRLHFSALDPPPAARSGAAGANPAAGREGPGDRP